jgi:Beta-propeller repeat/Putative binding domain, N-terminal
MLSVCLWRSIGLLSAQNTVSIPGGANAEPTAPATLRRDAVTLAKYDKLPLAFERVSDSRFQARGQGYSVNIGGVRATIGLPSSGTIEMQFVHAKEHIAIPDKELPGKVNYIRGNDPQRWKLGLSTYERVTYPDLYPGIDVVYYGNQKQLEFDLVLKPGADVKTVRMRFSGPRKPHTDPSGDLVLGDLRLRLPTVIQGKKNISARYKLVANGEVAFEVGAYDRRQTLIVDPTLVYSTRHGGGNGYNQAGAIALDASGNAYISGYTSASDFPVTNPAFAGYDASSDAFVSKVNSAGTALIYSTYIGGSGFDNLFGIAVDSTGAAWAAGYTFSSDFPLLSPYQSTYCCAGAAAAVVLKLNPGGGLAYSTYLGGPSAAYAIAVDPFGNAYATGYANPGFPTTAGVYEQVNQGSQDAFVTKFAPSGALTWSTFLGGTNDDYGTGIAADEFGNTYITGFSSSTTFPNAPPGGAQPVNGGNGDAFIAKLNFNGSALIFLTFLGGSGTDTGQAISVDPVSGISIVAGLTTSTDLPVSAGALQNANAGGYDGFVAKLNAAGSAFLYTTYLGGNRRDILLAVAMDSSGNAYVAGYSDSNTFPTIAAVQPAVQGNSTSLFRTSNTGSSWTPFDTSLSGAALGLSPDPVNAGTIVASTDNGTYRTTNGGATWTQQTTVGYMTLARSPATPSTIYGSTGQPIYQSIDNGVTWSFKGSISACCQGGIIADPLNAATAYVINSFNSSLPAVQKTVNSGVSWSPATNGLLATAFVTAIAAGSDGSLYIGLSYSPGVSPGGLYKSTNQGASWVAINSGLYTNLSVPPQGLVVSQSNSSVLYVTDYFTLYESTNGGSTWSAIGPLPGGTSALAVSSTSPSTLFYSAYDSPSQMWVSTNSGASWSQATGIGVASPNRIVPDPVNGAGAYALSSVSTLPVVAKIDSAGQNLLYSTYLGDYGAAYGITTDGTGDAYVAGSTWEFPTTPSALQRNRNYNANNLDAFVARISDATAACSYSVDPPESLELWFSHLIQYVVTAPSGCSWTASSNQPWATIASGAAGNGSGIVYVLVVSNNTAATTLTATLTIAGQSVTLTQRPGGCGYNSFNPEASVVPGSGGPVVFNVVAGAGCQWTITNSDPTAITIVSGASGTGNGTVTLNVAPNLGPNTRTFYVPSPQGDQETISQAGTIAPAVVSTITSSPSGASITVIGTGCIPGTYATPASLTWNANTNCTINFTTPQTIGGLPYTFYSATVNGGPSTSTNPLTVNSGTSPPTINANFLAPCTYSLSPSGQAFGATGGVGSFTVNTASACSWTPTRSAAWITILPSASKGTGKVNYAIAANSGATRAGTISIGGQNYNIDQAAFSCSYSIGPSFASPDDSGGNVSVSVSAPGGCAWTAVSNVPWVTVHSGASGSGSGVVVLTVAPNADGPRSGTATIAGQTFTVNQGAGACGAVDETSALSSGFSPGGFQPEGVNLFYQKITITNRTGAAISGPLNYVLVGLPSSGTGTTGAWPFTYCFSTTGNPIVPIAPGGLAAGQSVTFSLDFVKPPSGGPLSYTPKILSGNPSK